MIWMKKSLSLLLALLLCVLAFWGVMYRYPM